MDVTQTLHTTWVWLSETYTLRVLVLRLGNSCFSDAIKDNEIELEFAHTHSHHTMPIHQLFFFGWNCKICEACNAKWHSIQLNPFIDPINAYAVILFKFHIKSFTAKGEKTVNWSIKLKTERERKPNGSQLTGSIVLIRTDPTQKNKKTKRF